jgi:hypothetical protein
MNQVQPIERDDYQAHPAANIFPLMQGAAFAALVEDIRKNGLHEPIVMDGSAILDGRNRWRACRAARVVPTAVQWDGVGSALDYVVSANLHRRQMSGSQRAMVGARIANMKHGGARRGDQAIKISLETVEVSCKQAAAIVGSSTALVIRARTILRDGTDEEIAAIESGAASVSGTVHKIWKRLAEPAAPRVAEVIQLHPVRRCHIPKLPTGMTPEEVARKAIELHKTVKSVDAVAAQLGIHKSRCRLMMDIVLIADRQDLSQRDAALAARALARMNEGRQRLDEVYASIKPIMLRLWGNRKGPSRASLEAQRADRFEHGLGILIQSCLNGAKIEVPHLSPESARKVLVDLNKAVGSVRILITKIERLSND